ncbi:MAG: GNAT family N-acetyltransferase [Candidatus Thalassarchaeaceae archaeon]|nr:GNAT family N-acetyltransferase [Candidatus Thalassarchaeaceae archaeon]
MTGLDWIPSESLELWSDLRLEKIQQLITQTTGELYRIERLRKLPLDQNFGRWVLSDGNMDMGILWAMRLSKDCARVLAFSVADDLQGNGVGADGWRHFATEAKRLGIRSVQLEVRQDNHTAIGMYHRRGLRPKGCISGFYRGYDGWLMRGPLLIDAASQ